MNNMQFSFDDQQANLQSIRKRLSLEAKIWEQERAYYKRKVSEFYQYADPETPEGKVWFDNLNYYRNSYRYCCKMTERYAKNIKEIKFLLKNLIWMRRNEDEWNEETV